MWPARSNPFASEDAGEPQPSIPPDPGNSWRCGKAFPRSCHKAVWSVSSLPSVEPKPGRSLHLPQVSIPTIPRCLGFRRAHLSLPDFTPCSPLFLLLPHHLLFSPRTPPKQPIPNYFSIIGPSAATSVAKLGISRVISAQSGATGRVISRRATSHPCLPSTPLVHTSYISFPVQAS